MAHPYPYANSAQALYWPALGPRFFDGWNSSEARRDRDLLCAEMSRLAYAQREAVAAALSTIKFSLHGWIGGETAEQRAATRGTDGFIATSDDEDLTVLAFRGTESNKPEDLLADAMATSIPWRSQDSSRGNVHRGFAATYARVRDNIEQALATTSGPLLITGHSLGAALATLAAADLGPRGRELITFGSPLVGDRTFRQELAGVTVRRFIDCCDLVARIPPKRFDASHIETLLIDLVSSPSRVEPIVTGLIKVGAAGLARALDVLHVRPEYEHVCDAIYVDRHGKRMDHAAADSIAADQQGARHDYRGGFTPDAGRLLHELKTVFEAGTSLDAHAMRVAVRDFGAKLFQGDPVPLRDLADHAPINYVSAFTGRVS